VLVKVPQFLGVLAVSSVQVSRVEPRELSREWTFELATPMEEEPVDSNAEDCADVERDEGERGLCEGWQEALTGD